MSALPALLFGLPIYVYIEQAFKARLIAERAFALRDMAVGAAALLSEPLAERDAALLALSPKLRSMPVNRPASNALIRRVQKTYPRYSWLSAADVSALIAAAATAFLQGEQVNDGTWFVVGLRSRRYTSGQDASKRRHKEIQPMAFACPEPMLNRYWEGVQNVTPSPSQPSATKLL